MAIPPGNRAISVVRWVARSWSIGVLVVWGAFFVEHLGWVAHPPHVPPRPVLAALLLHLALLVSLVAGWRWELAGGAAVVVASIAFFTRVAGENASQFTLVTALPGLLWMWCGARARAARRDGGDVSTS